MSRRRRVQVQPADNIDSAALRELVNEYLDRGRWPKLNERPDLAGREGIVVIGPRGHPYSTLHPTNPVLAHHVRETSQHLRATEAEREALWQALLVEHREQIRVLEQGRSQ